MIGVLAGCAWGIGYGYVMARWKDRADRVTALTHGFQIGCFQILVYWLLFHTRILP